MPHGVHGVIGDFSDHAAPPEAFVFPLEKAGDAVNQRSVKDAMEQAITELRRLTPAGCRA